MFICFSSFVGCRWCSRVLQWYSDTLTPAHHLVYSTYWGLHSTAYSLYINCNLPRAVNVYLFIICTLNHFIDVKSAAAAILNQELLEILSKVPNNTNFYCWHCF